MDNYLRKLRRAYLEGQEDAVPNYIAALERIVNQPQAEYEVERTLVLNTNHVSDEDATFLEISSTDDPAHTPVWLNYPEGWILHTCFTDPTQLDNLPENIKRLIQLARSLNCEWLRLDRDAPLHENLPKWDW